MSILPKPFAFVLMPFEEAFRDTYLLGIKPACEEAGYYCERLDEQMFEETMLERIYNQIAKADLVVADLTTRNPNVFYETGYAHALGQRVVLLTRNSDDIPFDLKHHFHIVYSDSIADLKNRLRARAAYYISHPNTPTRSPFEQVTLLLNGQAVDWNTESIGVASRVQSQRDDSWIRLDAAFHLSEAALDSEVEIVVRLITDAFFESSGWEMNGGLTYTSITMPDGRIMHKPHGPARISVGDPDKIVFDLHPTNVLEARRSHSMTLQLMAAGLRRDLKLSVEAE